MIMKTMKLDKLMADPANPRTHDARNLEAIEASLREHGQVEPLVVQKSSMMVIAGNGRAEAMRKMGWKLAEVVLLDVGDVEARRLSIALNRSGELAGWDEGILAKHLQELSEVADIDWSFNSLGFNEEEFNGLVAAFGDVVEELEMDSPPEIKQLPDDEANGDLPPGTSPSPMPNSGVRMVQLFLSEDTIDGFQMAVRHLAKEWGTDNITDTVYKAVLQKADSLQDVATGSE